MIDGHRLIRTFHSTCMVSDYDATIDALSRVAGLRVLEYSEAELVGRRGGMTWIGDNSIEVAQPIVEGHAAQRFLRTFGPGMHSFALQVADLDATIAHFDRHGITVGARPDEGFCFTHPNTTGGLLFEWSDFTVAEDPRLGANLPPRAVEPVLDVQTHAFAGALVPDPVRWAETFGPVFGLAEAFRRTGAGAGEPVIGLAAPDCTLALYRLDAGQSAALWGAGHTRPRFHVLGLGVPDLGDAVRALTGAGLGIVRRRDDAVVVRPVDTGEVPLVLVDELPEGDPRGVPAGPARPSAGPGR